MQITFYEKNKKIELSIINYWFPFNHDIDDVENDFYANYLAVKIVYSSVKHLNSTKQNEISPLSVV